MAATAQLNGCLQPASKYRFNPIDKEFAL